MPRNQGRSGRRDDLPAVDRPSNDRRKFCKVLVKLRQIAELCQPVVELMQSRVLESRIIWTDDMIVPVLDPPRKQTKTGRRWVYIGDVRHRYAVFDDTPDRKGIRPREFLSGLEGYLQADAYSGYDELCDRGPVTEVARWAHARREFHEAKISARVGATYALNVNGQLYGLERNAAKADAARRLKLRLEHPTGHLSRFQAWLDDQSGEVTPKTPLGGAIGYGHNHWEALRRSTEDGELSIDNNLSQRTLRCVLVGRKNWLFAGSDHGGETAATLFSLIASSKLLRVDPDHYFRGSLTELTGNHDGQDPARLLTDRWLKANPGAKLTDHCNRSSLPLRRTVSFAKRWRKKLKRPSRYSLSICATFSIGPRPLRIVQAYQRSKKPSTE